MELREIKTKARGLARDSVLTFDDLLARAGLRHSPERLARDSAAYWAGRPNDTWKSNSHWRDGGVFDDALWNSVGADHLELWSMFARSVGQDRTRTRIVEWGAGGGANAVHFTTITKEFVAVDVVAASLAECERQVRAVSDTSFVPILVDVDEPEAVLEASPGPCDLFLCLYVMELVPSEEYGLRLLRIARRLLTDGGLAMIQIKYRTIDVKTRSRRRSYGWNVANMTTYPIDEFWTAAQSTGLTPLLVKLVPRNELDERYAYFLLEKSAASA